MGNVRQFLNRNAFALGGATLGGGFGAASGYNVEKDTKKRKITRKQRLFHAGVSGLASGILGGLAGRYLDRAKNYSYYRRGGQSYGGAYTPPSARPPIKDSLSHLGATGKEKTKAEVKKKFREAAMKHHPDRGGNEETMKKVNTAWDHLQEEPWFQKLAFEEDSFLNGFLKRASMCNNVSEHTIY